MQARRTPIAAWKSLTLTLALLANLVVSGLMLALPLGVSAASLNVATTGNDNPACGPAATPCKTIEYTVNTRAVNGDTISIAAGTYQEQVHIAKNLTITGAGAGATTILSLANPAINNPAAVDPIDRYAAIVDVRGGAVVTLSGVTIAGPSNIAYPTKFEGVHVGGSANLTFSNSTVRDIRSASFGAGVGVGVRVGSYYPLPGDPGTATLTNLNIYNYEKSGLVADGASSATMTGSTLTGVGSNQVIAQNGVQISYGATATLTNNTISNNVCDFPFSCGPDPNSQAQAFGVLLYGAGAVSLTGNTIAGNDAGIVGSPITSAPVFPLGNVNVASNAITSNRYEGVYLAATTATISSNDITGTSNVAVRLESFNTVANNTVATLTNNNIHDASRGVQIIDSAPADAFNVVVTASNNSLSGNGTGVENTTNSQADFRFNWWGTPLGPQAVNNSYGDGPSVIGNVLYFGLLIDGTDTSNARGFQPKAGCGAKFTDTSLADNPCTAVSVLAGRNVIVGYNDTQFGPTDKVQRAQVAAFLVRALGFQDRPQGPRTFSDLGPLEGTDLAKAVRIVANACDAQGCVAVGPGDGTFQPTKEVTKAEVIAFISRAFRMSPRYAWVQQSGPSPYGGVPSGLQPDVATYVFYAGPIPDGTNNADDWNSSASREWVARVLFQALQTKP